MKNGELVKAVRSGVKTLRDKGHDAISLAALDAYLERLETLTRGEPSQLDQQALRQAQAELDFRLAEYKRVSDEGLEMFRSVISTGLSARRDSMLINGGGAVALLAFAGHLVTKADTADVGDAGSAVASLAIPLVWFLGGVLAVAVASGATYVAQRCWSQGRVRTGKVFNGLAIALVLASYVTFAAACWLGFDVLRNLPR